METQQRKYRLVSRLYRGAAVAFWGMLILMLYSIFTDITKGNPENRMSAYCLPVHMQLNNTPDTLIDYTRTHYHKGKKTGFSMGTIVIDNGVSSYTKKEIDSIVNDTTFKKKFTTHHTTHFDPADEDVFEVTEVMGYAKGSVNITSKSLPFTVLLFIHFYAGPLTFLVVLGLLSGLLKKLNRDFSFSQSLAKGIKLIGYALLVYEVVAFVTDWLVSNYFGQVYFMEQHGAEAADTVFNLSADGYAGWGGVFAGLFLVTLSKLLQYGYELQQENDLTV